jgi:hypothetical protein
VTWRYGDAVPVGVAIGLCSALLTALVTEVYCHRALAHRAFRVRPGAARVLDVYFRVIVWTSPETWAAVHRLHHRHADTPLDPHSPQQLRPWQVLVGSPYLFALARRRLPADRAPGRVVWALRVLVPVAYLLAIGPGQTVVATAVHLAGYLGIMGMVNTVGHLYGAKPTPTRPATTWPGWPSPCSGTGTTTPTTPTRLPPAPGRSTRCGPCCGCWPAWAWSTSETAGPGPRRRRRPAAGRWRGDPRPFWSPFLGLQQRKR